jgi:hypothetical protein
LKEFSLVPLVFNKFKSFDYESTPPFCQQTKTAKQEFGGLAVCLYASMGQIDDFAPPSHGGFALSDIKLAISIFNFILNSVKTIGLCNFWSATIFLHCMTMRSKKYHKTTPFIYWKWL